MSRYRGSTRTHVAAQTDVCDFADIKEIMRELDISRKELSAVRSELAEMERRVGSEMCDKLRSERMEMTNKTKSHLKLIEKGNKDNVNRIRSAYSERLANELALERHKCEEYTERALASLKEEVGRLSSSLEQTTFELTTTKEKAELHASQLTSERDRLENELRIALAEVEDLSDLWVRQKGMTGLGTTKAELFVRIETLAEKNATLEKTVVDLNRNIERRKSTITSLTNDVANVSAQLVEKQQEHEERLAALHQHYTAQKKQMAEDHKVSMDALLNKNLDLQRSLDLQAVVSERQGEAIEQLSSDLDKSQKIEAELRKELDEASTAVILQAPPPVPRATYSMPTDIAAAAALENTAELGTLTSPPAQFPVQSTSASTLPRLAFSPSDAKNRMLEDNKFLDGPEWVDVSKVAVGTQTSDVEADADADYDSGYEFGCSTMRLTFPDATTLEQESKRNRRTYRPRKHTPGNAVYSSGASGLNHDPSQAHLFSTLLPPQHPKYAPPPITNLEIHVASGEMQASPSKTQVIDRHQRHLGLSQTTTSGVGSLYYLPNSADLFTHTQAPSVGKTVLQRQMFVPSLASNSHSAYLQPRLAFLEERNPHAPEKPGHKLAGVSLLNQQAAEHLFREPIPPIEPSDIGFSARKMRVVNHVSGSLTARGRLQSIKMDNKESLPPPLVPIKGSKSHGAGLKPR